MGLLYTVHYTPLVSGPVSILVVINPYNVRLLLADAGKYRVL